MSETTPFSYPKPFPFALTSAPLARHDRIGGLTREQVRRFWWNLESVSIATAGEYDGGLGFQLDLDNSFSAPDGVTTTQLATNALADSGGVIRMPKTRVSVLEDEACAFLYEDTDSFSNVRQTRLVIVITKDPDDEDFYALQYQFLCLSYIAEDGLGLAASNPAYYEASGTPGSSGNFTLDGHVFSWVGGSIDLSTEVWDAAATTPITVTTSASFFTYPA